MAFSKNFVLLMDADTSADANAYAYSDYKMRDIVYARFCICKVPPKITFIIENAFMSEGTSMD